MELERKKGDENYIPEFLSKAIESDLDDLFTSKRKGRFVVIRKDGKTMQFRSKKQVWSTKAAASLAISNHLNGHHNLSDNSDSRKFIEMFPSKKDYKQFLIDNGYLSIKEIK